MSSSFSGPRRTAPAPGFTLLELAVALTLVAVVLAIGVPLGRATLDQWTVRAIRDQALAALHRTRMEARIHGGAELVFDGDGGMLVARAADSVLWERRDAADASVSIELPDGTTFTSLTFDRLGLGVVSSRTILFRRGEAVARLVVSSRGRGARR